MPIMNPAQLTRISRSPVLRALAFPHPVDHYLELINPMWSGETVRARIEQVRHLTPGSTTLRLRPNGCWRGFRAGQFVQLSVEIDGVRRSRCYSPANAEHERDCIELTIKAHEDGLVSRHLLRHAAVGQVLELTPAAGDFALPQARPGRVLLISGGSGITPVMSMLRTLLAEQHPGRISFLHYADRVEDLIYNQELSQIAAAHPQVEIIRVLRDGGGGEAEGLFSAAQLRALVPDFADAETFLCGPPALMALVEGHWREAGLGGKLHQERFTLPGHDSAPLEDATVHYPARGLSHPDDGRSLLEQAEAAGLSPASGCRMGICATCTCRKTSGRVKNLLTGEISGEADEDIRICISVAAGDVTLDL